MKWVGMYIVWLRDVNFAFLSHLGCSGKNAIIRSTAICGREGLVLVSRKEM